MNIYCVFNPTNRGLRKLIKPIAAAVAVFCAVVSNAAEPYGINPDSHRSTELYWGDTHIHTSYSTDANFAGNTRLSPVQAYEFAKGKAVVTSTEQMAQLDRPLDFVVVADHSESLGLMPYLRKKEPLLMAMPGMKALRDSILSAKGITDYLNFMQEHGKTMKRIDSKAREKIWRDYVAMADRANEPGVFTALVGYEWGSTPNGNNLHRVVVFRDGGGVADQTLPLTSTETDDPMDLWRTLENYHNTTGGEVLSISHNGNLSNGLMFPELMSNGKPIDKEYAALRQRWEPLSEVTQTKGDGETHPLLSPDDEFADFSTWDKRNVVGTAAKEPWMLKYEYARSALMTGLEISQRIGVNPYEFGMIGSTDSHTSLATADDNNYWGMNGTLEPGAERMNKAVMPSSLDDELTVMSWEQDASGYAAVWAKSNTREDIFDALARKEVYTSTGPRIVLRFFGGWDFSDNAVLSPDYVQQGYAKGVPMGGQLSKRGFGAKNQSPVFLISALRDVNGANLDRIQVVKGWLDKQGKAREKVYDVAWSDRRKLDKAGKLDKVGNTVDVKKATYLNSIGSSALSATWRDPEFDSAVHAFYYVRVLEIPTPRWPAYDAAHFNAEPPEMAELVHQERVYSSPIWYVPEK